MFNPSTYTPNTHINISSKKKRVLIFVLHLLKKQTEVQKRFANCKGGHAGQGIILKVLPSCPRGQYYLQLKTKNAIQLIQGITNSLNSQFLPVSL